MFRLLSAFATLLTLTSTAVAQREFGFDNRKTSGQPYLKPDESVKRMKVADGFEVKLFAAEPLVVNPVAMTVDEKGRVWVIECFEYPKRTAKGKMPRDRIVILEDTKGTGVADKRTVFAEGKDFPVPFDLATGLEVGNGGVYVGAPPYLFFIENKNDKPGKFEVLLKGFGSQDTHETLNTFQWGPDGRLYGLHGVFTHSEVTQADGPATRLNAGVWRYDTRAKKFDVFAEGTSNPWGMDWRNTDGQVILACCVIPHLFHMVPGGTYKRQAGQSFNPYAYGYINEICDHTFHKESGWAHAGLLSLDTPLMPKEYRDSVIFGSIHGCSIKRNTLKPNGSTFTASRADDFLVSGDKNFRPINLRWGPNGEIYCIDWHDQNPCHQAAADRWDYQHGRVYRIQPKGLTTKLAEDLGQKSPAELLKLVSDDNPYRARTALRMIREQREQLPPTFTDPGLDKNDVRVVWATQAWNRPVMLSGEVIRNRLQSDGVTEAFRVWFIRMFTDRADATPDVLNALAEVAVTEKSPRVRSQLASTALQHPTQSGDLLHALLQHAEDARDPVIPQLLWMAVEKRQSATEVDWLKTHAVGNALILDTMLPRTARRLAAAGKAEELKLAVDLVAATDAVVRRKALDGLAVALKGRQVAMPPNWPAVNAILEKDADADIKRLAHAVAVSFRDPGAVRTALATARDAKKLEADRIAAIHSVGVAHLAEAKLPLLELLRLEKSDALRQEVCHALANFDGPEIPLAVLKEWKTLPHPVRDAAVGLLAGRKEWALELLKAVADKRIAPADVSNNAILRITAHKDKKLDALVKSSWGEVRDTPADLTKLIDKMRGELSLGSASFERGKFVFEKQCMKCHRFEGRGNHVGPELDGAGRDIEYLLVNILDPNRVVGAPYFQRVVTTTKGQVYTGLLAAEDAETLSLKTENEAIRVIARKEIESIVVSQKSMMPEGLDKNMTTQDFRDLLRYLMLHPYVEIVSASGPYPKPLAPDAIDKAEPQRRLETPVTGRIPLPPKGGGENVAYVFANVTASKPLKTQLHIHGGESLRIWLNGKIVFEGIAKEEKSIDVELKQGENRLVTEEKYREATGSLRARFVDPHRVLRSGGSETVMNPSGCVRPLSRYSGRGAGVRVERRFTVAKPSPPTPLPEHRERGAGRRTHVFRKHVGSITRVSRQRETRTCAST